MEHRDEIVGKSWKTYVFTFKTIAFTSFILGIGQLSICLWVLIALTEHDEPSNNLITPTASKFRLAAIIYNQAQGRDRGRSSISENWNGTKPPENEDAELKDLQEKFSDSWNSVAPYFQGSCGISLTLGLVQVVSSMAILSSSSKGASKPLRANVWKLTHFLLGISFLVCFAIPVTIDKSRSDGGIVEHLKSISEQLKKLGADKTLDAESVDNMGLLYITLIVNAVGEILLVIVAHVVLNWIKKK